MNVDNVLTLQQLFLLLQLTKNKLRHLFVISAANLCQFVWLFLNL